ncbi:MAG: CBS domain-containing protein [Candidatus Aenigmatarchaeota archaeon]
MKLRALVKDVMNKNVRTIGLDDSVENAAKIMKKYDVGSVLVIGEKNVKGIITTKDVVYKCVADKCGSTAKEIMTKDVITISPNTTIEDAAKLMVERNIEKLPVLDNNRIVGIITNNDILRVEPALFEILLERMKIGLKRPTDDDLEFEECEVCGNYSDDIEEVNGVATCAECRD